MAKEKTPNSYPQAGKGFRRLPVSVAPTASAGNIYATIRRHRRRVLGPCIELSGVGPSLALLGNYTASPLETGSSGVDQKAARRVVWN
jgi:hypothetical protein